MLVILPVTVHVAVDGEEPVAERHVKNPQSLMKPIPRDQDAALQKWQIRRVRKRLKWLIRRKLLKPLAGP